MSWMVWAISAVIGCFILLVVARAATVNTSARFGRGAVARVLRLASEGRLADALQAAEEALTLLPPPNECTGEVAQPVFLLLILASDLTRKITGDAAHEQELLLPAVALADRVPSVVDPTSRPGQYYMVQMNLGNADVRLKRWEEAADAHRAAAHAADTPETRCKSWIYNGWDILRTGKPARWPEAWDAFAAAESEPTDDHILLGQLAQGKAMQALATLGDRRTAQAEITKATMLDGTSARARRIAAVLTRPDATVEDCIRAALDESAESSMHPPQPQVLPPLSMDSI